MTVIADVTVPADTFAIGRALEGLRDIEIELERIVPLGESMMPLFWIAGGDCEEVCAHLKGAPPVELVEPVTSTDEASLFEVHWDNTADEFVDALVATDAKILEATGTPDSWDFRLRFSSREDLSSFNMVVTDSDIPITLRHIYNPSVPASGSDSPLSDTQRETLVRAYRSGYFEVPRQVTLEELSEHLDISDSALSQRLRRGINGLIEQNLAHD